MDGILNNTEVGKVQLEVQLEKESVWLTQDQPEDQGQGAHIRILKSFMDRPL